MTSRLSKRIVEPMNKLNLDEPLENEGYEHVSAMDGEEALQKFETEKPDLIILDIMMPKLSGTDVCRKLREKSRVPIIMLTAKGEEIDRILGLELGADDYIVKPFSAREVVARVKAVLRRLAMAKEHPQQVLRFDDLEININNYDVRVKGERVPFTPKEVEIFQLLASHPGKVYERETILSLVWGYDFYGDDRTLDTHVKLLRKSLGRYSRCIITLRGVGYRFETVAEPESDADGDAN